MLCSDELLSHRERRPSARGLRLGTTGLLIGLLAGCGNPSASDATVYPVPGKVLLSDGKPLTTGRVEFIPVKGGMPAAGDLGPDGSFSLKTGTGQEGAPAGEYKVRLEPTALTSKKKGASPLVY